MVKATEANKTVQHEDSEGGEGTVQDVMPSEELPLCGLFINKEIHNKIKKLDVLRNFDGEITIVWMYSKASEESLFYFSTGSLDKSINNDDGSRTILTYCVINDRLHRYIKDEWEKYLSPLDQEKKGKLIKHGPPYLFTKSLPHLRSIPVQTPEIISDSDSEYSSDESDDEEWYYECEDILYPEKADDPVGNGLELYTYRSGCLTVTIKEPADSAIGPAIESCAIRLQ